MAKTISFGSGLAEPVTPQYARSQLLADQLLSQGQGPVSGWGEAIGKLGQTFAGLRLAQRARTEQETTASARAKTLGEAIAAGRSGGSQAALDVLAKSGDPELSQMGAQYAMAQLLEPGAEPDLVQAVGPDGRMTWVPKSQAAGMQSALPEAPKAPPSRTRDVNGMTIQEEMRPDGTWGEIGSRPTFAPQQPKEPRIPGLVTLYKDGQAQTLRDNDPQIDMLVKSGWVSDKPQASSAKPGDLPESLKFYTDKVKPYIDAAAETRRQGNVIQTALAQGNGTGDIAAITAFNKLLDPGAVVREADVNLTLAAQGIADQLAVWVKNKQEGDILPPALREKMLTMSQQIVQTGLDYSKARINSFRQPAEKYGVTWSDILAPNVEQQLFNPQVNLGTNPPPNQMGGPDERGVPLQPTDRIIRYDAQGNRIP